MQRYKLTIAYRGTAYHGWQHQEAAPNWKGPVPPPGQGIPTVQETLTRALRSVVRHPVTLVGSSRTDAGVHAKGQVAHFDTIHGQIPADGLRRALNYALPENILVRAIEPVDAGFCAVGRTVAKRYQYAIHNAPDRPVFAADLSWHRWQPLDLSAMRAAAALLVGTHDFTSFARPGHDRASTVRGILECSVAARGQRIVIGITGTGFLWHMVRIIVGTLTEVALGRYPPGRIADMLAARDRRAAGPTAPPHGLYLQWIRFGMPGDPADADELE